MTAYRYFTNSELECKCGCKQQKMDEDFMWLIDNLREDCGFPFIVSSAYRCPEYNAQVSSTGGAGPHTTGKAIDVKVYHKHAHKLLKLATQYGFKGIGVSQKGDYKTRFIHIDNARDDFAVWSY